MDRIDAIQVPRTLPRPAAAADVAAVLDRDLSRRPRKDVPVDVLRDRVLFETAYVCGARASEVCGMYVEDLDLRPDDEHARVHGKGGTVRTVLLDDRGYVALLRLYLARARYTAGPAVPRQYQTAGAARCPTTRRTAGGRSTAPPQVPGSASTSSATPTPASFQQRRVHRGRAPSPRPRLRRDHPGLHPACRQGRRRRDPRCTPPTGPVSELTGLALSRLDAIACTW